MQLPHFHLILFINYTDEMDHLISVKHARLNKQHTRLQVEMINLKIITKYAALQCV